MMRGEGRGGGLFVLVLVCSKVVEWLLIEVMNFRLVFLILGFGLSSS